jgi:hypothetical protein
MMNVVYASYEYLAVDKVTVFLKSNVTPKQYIPKKQMFWNKKGKAVPVLN